MQFGKCKPNGKMAFVGQALKTLLIGRGLWDADLWDKN
jgi:hypothetical protein